LLLQLAEVQRANSATIELLLVVAPLCWFSKADTFSNPHQFVLHQACSDDANHGVKIMRTASLQKLIAYLLRDLSHDDDNFSMVLYVRTNPSRDLIAELKYLCEQKGVRRAVWRSNAARAAELSHGGVGHLSEEVASVPEKSAVRALAHILEALYLNLVGDEGTAKVHIKLAVEQVVLAALAAEDSKYGPDDEHRRDAARSLVKGKVYAALTDALIDAFV
jgi:hypothetical protein